MAFSPVRRISVVAVVAFMTMATAVAPDPSRAAPPPIPTDFDWSPAAPTPGQVVSFVAAASPADGITVTSYDWDLNGDGSVDAHGQTATWSYPVPGPVNVRLSVQGNGAHRGEAVHLVPVQAAGGGDPSPRPPVASFTIAPSAPIANQPVLFTSTSSDPDGTLTEEVWDLNGDGNYDNGAGPAALRAFADAGNYVVGLRVTDDAGLVGFDSRTVTVLPPGTAIATQSPGLRLLSPFPVVRIAGRISRGGTRVRLVRVKAPVGSTVSVRCSGRSCPFKKHVRAVRRGARPQTTVSVRIRRLERLLRPGVRVRLYVTKHGMVGKYTRLRFRADKAPLRADSCVMPGSWTPAECPAL